MTITVNDLVAREVHYCVSSLVSTLATAVECAGVSQSMRDLTEQAFELACPVADWEEAAIESGWRHIDGDMYGRGEERASARDWEALCDANDIDCFDREVFEHWIVSDWLADRLAEKGEKVDKDFAGMTVWARTTTGQQIAADSVIEQIHAELVRS